jgi:acyl transferase domain-containing protein
VHLEKRNIKVITKRGERWPRELRRGSVNSFGFGGASAHLILESPSSFLGARWTETEWRPDSSLKKKQLFVLPVSSSSKTSLEARIEHVAQAVKGYNEAMLYRLAYTLSQRRSQLEYKRYLLAEVVANEDVTTTVLHESPSQDDTDNTLNPLSVAFVFTGQGSQYPGMASQLLHRNTTFSNTIDTLDSTLQSLPPQYAPDWTLRQAMLESAEMSRVNDVDRSQPLCTALQIALVDMLSDWNIKPESVVGHSSGEIAAAYAAGLLTAAQAIKVAYFRGYAVAQLHRPGLMLAAGLTAEAAESLIVDKGFSDQACVACINSSDSVTLSGAPEAIEALEAELNSQSTFNRRLKTGGQAYHSHMMKEIGPLYGQLLTKYLGSSQLSHEATAAMYSSVAGVVGQLDAFHDSSEMAKYWQDNLESPVHFSSAIENLVSNGSCHMIEIGPHGAMKGPLRRIRVDLGKTERHCQYSATLDRTKDADACMQNLAGSLFLKGYKLNWYSVNGLPRSGLKHIHNLPTYPWDYSAGLLWYEPRPSINLRNREHVRHELLGSLQLADDGIHMRWRNILQLSEMPWLSGHKVEDQVVFPATGYLAVAMEAVSQILGIRNGLEDLTPDMNVVFEFRDVNIRAALVVPDEDGGMAGPVELHTAMAQRKLSTATVSSDWYDFTISSWRTGQSTIHCEGGIRVDSSAENSMRATVRIPDYAQRFEAFDASRWYERARTKGSRYDGDFQCLKTLHMDANRKRRESVCVTRISPPVAAHPHSTFYPMHPITMDACLQAPIIGCSAGDINKLEAYLPVFIAEGFVRARGRYEQDCEAYIHTRGSETGFATRRVDVTLQDGDSKPFVDLRGVRLSLYSGAKADNQEAARNQKRHPCLRPCYKPDIYRFCRTQREQIDAHVTRTMREGLYGPNQYGIVGALLDLAGHKTPNMRVLEISKHSQAEEWLRVLDHGSSFPRLASWSTAEVSQVEDVDTEIKEQGPFVGQSWQFFFWNPETNLLSFISSL